MALAANLSALLFSVLCSFTRTVSPSLSSVVKRRLFPTPPALQDGSSVYCRATSLQHNPSFCSPAGRFIYLGSVISFDVACFRLQPSVSSCRSISNCFRVCRSVLHQLMTVLATGHPVIVGNSVPLLTHAPGAVMVSLRS